MVLTRIAATALLVVAALTGCAREAEPQPVTDATLLSELQAAGVQPANGIAAWRDVVPKAVCDESEDVLKLSLTMREMTEGVMKSMRVAAVHFCPAREPLIAAALRSR